MLTRREVLLQLKRVGVTEASQMKTYVRDFEMYMAKNHGISIIKAKTGGQQRAKSIEHRERGIGQRAKGGQQRT